VPRPVEPVTSAAVPIANARGGRIAGLLASAAAVLAAGVVGCTSIIGGDAAVDALEAPAYRSSVAASSSQSAASSSARESQRQATQAVLMTCETFSASSAEAIAAVNEYVDAFNGEGSDVESTQGPAAEALDRSAQEVQGSISDIVPAELRDAFTAWSEGARTAAEAINGSAEPEEFNQIIDDLNDIRTNAQDLCDRAYR